MTRLSDVWQPPDGMNGINCIQCGNVWLVDDSEMDLGNEIDCEECGAVYVVVPHGLFLKDARGE